MEPTNDNGEPRDMRADMDRYLIEHGVIGQDGKALPTKNGVHGVYLINFDTLSSNDAANVKLDLEMLRMSLQHMGAMMYFGDKMFLHGLVDLDYSCVVEDLGTAPSMFIMAHSQPTHPPVINLMNSSDDEKVEYIRWIEYLQSACSNRAIGISG